MLWMTEIPHRHTNQHLSPALDI